jgi:hypothetical protein
MTGVIGQFVGHPPDDGLRLRLWRPWFRRLDGANGQGILGVLTHCTSHVLWSPFRCGPWVRSYGVGAAPGVATTRPAAWAALLSRWS